MLYVVTGEGRAQKEGEPAVTIGSEDIVYFAPGEKHWHGAEPDTFMVYMAINPANTSCGGTDWLQPVTDESTRVADKAACSRSYPPTAECSHRWRRRNTPRGHWRLSGRRGPWRSERRDRRA